MPTGSAQSVDAKVSIKAKSAENRFFTGYMLLIAVLILLGFARTFFLRGIVPTPAPLAPLTPLLILHGFLASMLVALLPLQANMIGSGKRALHMTLGKVIFALGVLLVPLAFAASASAYHNAPPDLPASPAALVALTTFALVAFVLIGSLAWRRRFDGPAHKRLIVAAACVLAGPAIARLPFLPLPPAGIIIAELAMLSMFLPLWLWDLASRGRPHWATVVGTSIFIAQTVIRGLVMNTTAWATFVASWPGFGAP